MKNVPSKLRQLLHAAVSLLMLLLFTGQALAKEERNLAVNQVNNAVSEQRIALVIGNGA